MAERLGNQVIEFKDVSKSFGDRVLIDKLSFTVPAGAIVGIIGPNGAGKSTLFRMIAGKEKPDSGEVITGPTVQMAFVEQSREDLDNKKTVFEDVSNGADILTVGKFEMPSRAYLGRFNFKGADQGKVVGNLSGGGTRAGCIWPRRSSRAAMCCCSTNRPTTSTSKPCAHLKMRFSNLPARSW